MASTESNTARHSKAIANIPEAAQAVAPSRQILALCQRIALNRGASDELISALCEISYVEGATWQYGPTGVVLQPPPYHVSINDLTKERMSKIILCSNLM